jgi:hypothetical protein
MPTKQESFFQAGLMIQLAADDLEGAIQHGIPMWDTEIVEICGRLREARRLIRKNNGGLG